MSRVSSLRSFSEEKAPILARQAAAQAGHDERVSHAFKLGAAYAMVRIFECGCHYTDYHAYEQQIPTRQPSPYSTSTSVHDFIRGPCIKSRCADLDFPDWWYQEECKNRYGLKDLEDCDEIIREVEDWEEQIKTYITDFRALHNTIKDRLHNFTYKQDLEQMAWMLICPPTWQEQMLTEWCPEMRDVRQWKSRAIDQAYIGGPRMHYEFCIDAAWESLRAVRLKVENELEPIIEALQKQQSYMVESFGVPQEPELLPSPGSPVSPGTVPTKSGRKSSLAGEAGKALSPDLEDAIEYVISTKPELLTYSETRASAGTSNSSGIEHFSQEGRTYASLPSSQPLTPPLAIGASEGFPRKLPPSDRHSSGSPAKQFPSGQPSTHEFTSVPTPEQWREVFQKAVADAQTEKTSQKSSKAASPSGATSTKHPNVSLPSEASAALFDIFASSNTPSSSTAASSSSHNPRKRSRANVEDDVDDIISLYCPRKRSRRARPSPLEGTPTYNALRELMGTRVYKVTEPDDSEDMNWIGSTHSGFAPIVTTTFIYYATSDTITWAVNSSTEGPPDASSFVGHASFPTSSRAGRNPKDTIPTHRSAQDLDRSEPTPFPRIPIDPAVDDSPNLPSAPPEPAIFPTLRANPANRGEAGSSMNSSHDSHTTTSSGSKKTKSSRQSWKQTLRVFKPWRLFQHRSSGSGSNKNNNRHKINGSGSILALAAAELAGAELIDLEQTLRMGSGSVEQGSRKRRSVRSKVSARWLKWARK